MISAKQAKGNNAAGAPIVQEMQLTDGDLPDSTHIQDIVTYDVVPELESYLLEISKQLHSSLDETEAHMKKYQKAGKEGEDSKYEDDDSEEVKEGEEEREGRSHKRENRKKK